MKVTGAKDRKIIDNNNVEAMLTCKTSSAVTTSSAQLLKRRTQVRKVMLILLEKGIQCMNFQILTPGQFF